MPLLFRHFSKQKVDSSRGSSAHSSPNHSQISQNSQPQSARTSNVSASELSLLQSEVWSLKNSLTESANVTDNMKDVITNIAKEKFELIEELNKSKKKYLKLENELRAERAIYANEKKSLLNEIFYLRTKLEQNQSALESSSDRNVKLERKLMEASETIYKIDDDYKD